MPADHNSLNSDVYNHDSSKVADFLVINQTIQTAIKLWLERLSSANPLRLLELGSGKRSDRWRIIATLETNRQWHVTLSDFTYAALPSQATLPHDPNFTFRLSQLNLLEDPFPVRTFDVVLATYVFDSIWFPQDQYVNRQHYPGGLIIKVKEAFNSCLDASGVFISIDRSSNKFVPEYETSGPARFKTENYEFAQNALTKSGFNVNLLSLNDFLSEVNLSLPLDLSDHAVLIVRK